MAPGGGGTGLEHVVFDLDGTLIDSRDDLASAVNHVLAQLGRPPLDTRVVTESVGDGVRVLLERTLGVEGDALPHGALETFLRFYEAHCLDHTRCYPGIEPALAALAADGVTLSVLTNKLEGLARRIVGGLGIEPHFAVIVGGDTLPTRKPDPGGLQHLLSRTATRVDGTVLVGDSPVDRETARAASVRFCGVAWGFVPGALRENDGTRCVQSPCDLVAALRNGSTPAQ